MKSYQNWTHILCRLRQRVLFKHFSFFSVGIFTAIALGIYLRVYDFFDPCPSLWLDESWRMEGLLGAKGLFHGMINGMNNIDPPFFSVIIFILAKIHNTESIVRLSSLLPSILSLFLVYLISKKIYKNKITVIWAVFIVSFHPFLIDYAKELKPYSLCLFVHLLIVYLFYYFRDKDSVAYIYVFSAVLLTSFFFSPNIIFIFPGIFLLLFLRQYKKYDYNGIKAVILSVMIILSFLILIYFFQLKNVNYNVQVNAWGDAFNLKDTPLWYIRWALKHYFTVINYFSMPNDLFELRSIIGTFFILLYVVGLVLLLSNERYEDFILFFFPLILLIVFNRLGMWPWGYVRTNLFIFGYIIFVVLYAVDIILSNSKGVLKPITFAVFIFFLITQFPYNVEKLKRKRVGRQEIRLSLNYMYNKVRNSKDPQYLLINAGARPQFRYYTRYHRNFSIKYKEISDRITPISLTSRTTNVLSKEIPKLYKKFPNLWIIFSNYRPNESKIALDKDYVQVIDKKKFLGSWVGYVNSKLYR